MASSPARVVLVAALALAAPVAGAQEAPSSASRAVTVRVAGVQNALPCICFDGESAPRTRALFVTAVGMRWPMLGDVGDRFRLDYAVELLPLVVSRGTADAAFRVFPCSDGGYCAVIDSPYPWTTNSYGVGVLPIGLVTHVHVAGALNLQLRLSGGVVRMSRPVPLVQGRKFNFIAEGAPVAELRLGARQSLVAGFAFNHISNGGTGWVNPGMDSRLIEVGYQLRR